MLTPALLIFARLIASPGQHNHGSADDNERSGRTQQSSTMARILERLNRHNKGVSKARPCGEVEPEHLTATTSAIA
jgi:hypothetical protein